jgi:hypothetical protein
MQRAIAASMASSGGSGERNGGRKDAQGSSGDSELQMALATSLTDSTRGHDPKCGRAALRPGVAVGREESFLRLSGYVGELDASSPASLQRCHLRDPSISMCKKWCLALCTVALRVKPSRSVFPDALETRSSPLIVVSQVGGQASGRAVMAYGRLDFGHSYSAHRRSHAHNV